MDSDVDTGDNDDPVDYVNSLLLDDDGDDRFRRLAECIPREVDQEDDNIIDFDRLTENASSEGDKQAANRFLDIDCAVENEVQRDLRHNVEHVENLDENLDESYKTARICQIKFYIL